MDKKEGKVIKVDSEKGFGFIEVKGYDKNVFFHAKDVKHIKFEQIRKGDIVMVDSIEESERGYFATGVYLIS